MKRLKVTSLFDKAGTQAWGILPWQRNQREGTQDKFKHTVKYPNEKNLSQGALCWKIPKVGWLTRCCSNFYAIGRWVSVNVHLSHLTHCLFLILFVGCLTSQQHASVSQGRICSNNFTCCHTEIEAADPTFYLTQSQYADTGPTSPSTDPITPGAWQGSHWSANF